MRPFKHSCDELVPLNIPVVKWNFTTTEVATNVCVCVCVRARACACECAKKQSLGENVGEV